MRLLLLVALALTPIASAWTLHVDAPEEAGSGLPFLVGVCVEAPAREVELKLDLVHDGARVARIEQENRTVALGRYGPALALEDGRACRDVLLDASDAEGDAQLLVRAREPGKPHKAEARADVRLARGDVARDDDGLVHRDGRLALRAPPGAFVPAWDAPGMRLRIVEARAGALEGVVVENAGAEDARLAGLALSRGANAWHLPDVALPAGARLVVGRASAPADGAFSPLDVDVRAGALALVAARRTLDVAELPPIPAGSAWTRDGVVRMGIAPLAPGPFEVEGALLAYATPHAGAWPVLDLIDGAQRDVLVEAYTLTSPEIGAALADALARGARVRMLLEGAPVGGVPSEERALVAALVARGAEIAFLESADGFPARFRSQHAKLVVVDRERALVATENFHASSYPAVPDGRGTRGFGIVVDDAALASALADMIEADLAPWPDARRATPDLAAPAPLAKRAGMTRGPALLASGGRVTMLASPMGGADALAEAMGAANASLDVALLFAEADSPLVRALVDAARRGVAVRLLLDGKVDDGGNAAVAETLRALAAREGLPLEARVDAAPRTLHAKLVVIDAARAYVGSMNWGRASMAQNREVGLLVESDEVASWYAARFVEDWSGPPEVRREVGGPVWLAMLALLSGRLRACPRRGRAPSRRSGA